MFSYKKAKQFTNKLGLKSSSEWYSYCDNKFKNLPEKTDLIPNIPKKYYINKGWKGWSDWLGKSYNPNWSNDKKLNSYLNFEKAKKLIKKYKMNGINDFLKLKNSGKLPKVIPKSPYYYKKDKNWIGLDDFLGTGRKPRSKKNK